LSFYVLQSELRLPSLLQLRKNMVHSPLQRGEEKEGGGV
jgi:hypothetical protein